MKNLNINFKKIYLLLLVIPLLLVACSSGKSLTKDEISNGVLANKDKVESYNVELNLDTSIKDVVSGDMTMSNKVSSVITINEKTLDSFGVIKTDSNQGKTSQEYYSVGNSAYLKMNNDLWEDVSSQQVEYFHNTSSFYNNLIPAVDIMSKMGDLKENNKEYIFNFAGNSVDIYQSFEAPYNLQFRNIAPKDIDQEVQIVIDKDSLFIKSVENTLTVQDSGEDLKIHIKQVYNNVNDINEFIIPQEIINEAT